MALQLLESFDDGATTLRCSVPAAAIGPSYGKDGSGVRLGDTPNYQLTVGIPNPSIVGFHFKIVASSGLEKFITYGTATNQQYGTVRWNSSSQSLEAETYNAAFQHRYAYSPAGSALLGVWNHLELKWFQSTGSVTTVEWNLNGAPILDEITDGDMAAVSQSIIFGGSASDIVDDFYMDNLYICDTTGGVNDTFLGPIRVDDLYPDGVGNYSNLTPSVAKANYETVDENPADGVEYVYSATEGDEDTYQMNDMTGTEDVAGVVANIITKKTDAGAKFVRPMVRIGGVDYTGTSGALTESYGLVTTTWDESPATASAWSQTEIDGMEVGQEVRDS